MKDLSSPLTFFYNFLFPLFRFAGFGVREVLFAPAAFATPFGRKFTFLPKHQLGSGLGKHPLVAGLCREQGLSG